MPTRSKSPEAQKVKALKANFQTVWRVVIVVVVAVVLARYFKLLPF